MPTGADIPDVIDNEKLAGWYDRFRYYRHPPSKEDIVKWISQFAPEHVETAAKVLDEVDIISDRQILAAFKRALDGLPGWSKEPNERLGRWAFVGLGHPAESGPAMLHMFREANRLDADRHQNLFVTAADLPQMKLTTADSVVFVDDFSGTGDQFVKRWELYQELLSGEPSNFLLLVAATEKAMSRLSGLSDIVVHSDRVIGEKQNVFSEENEVFSKEEKDLILNYCKKAYSRKPKGYGDCGLLLVISRKTPSNSLPILYNHNRKWNAIFPRQTPL